MDTLISPTTELKIRKRVNLKHRDYNFKDILRERFKSRIKCNRKSLLDSFRKLKNDVRSTVSQYIQSEVDYLKTEQISFLHSDNYVDVNDGSFERLVQSIKEELIQEQIEWIAKEMQEEEDYQIMSLTDEQVVCPLCQRGTLSDKQDDQMPTIVCSACDVILSLSINSGELRSKLQQFTNEHSNTCTKMPQFAVFNEEDINGLFIICHDCSTFLKII